MLDTAGGSYAELNGDLFCGFGGWSLGHEMATGREVDFAVNHWARAIQNHTLNHGETEHFISNVWSQDVSPTEICQGRPVGRLVVSPDCTHFSKAKGAAKKRSARIRSLAWIVHLWAMQVGPRIIFVENVEEFLTWGPLGADGQPNKKLAGKTFRRWFQRIINLGYKGSWKIMRACDYGAPTSRKRLFFVFRRDGVEPNFPEPTHGKLGSGLLPYHTAAECIDFSLPVHSIFLDSIEGRRLGIRRPLAEPTLRRIAVGVVRHVLENPHPFVVPKSGRYVAPSVGSNMTNNTGKPVTEPSDTVTGGGKLFVTEAQLAPILVQTGQGERQATETTRAQDPRCLDLHKPHPTIVGCGQRSGIAMARLLPVTHGEETRTWDPNDPLTTTTGKRTHAMVEARAIQVASLVKNNGGHEGTGQKVTRPVDTVTSRDSKALSVASLVKLRGTSTACPVDAPAPTSTASGTHLALSEHVLVRSGELTESELAGAVQVFAFLMRYNGTFQNAFITGPSPTITTVEGLALVTVTVDCQSYVMVDIGMRMLTPRELARCQGFPDSYVLEGTKEEQVRMIGNSVCPQVAAALIRANPLTTHRLPRHRIMRNRK